MAARRVVALGGRDMVAMMRLAGVREAYVVDAESAGSVYERIRGLDAIYLVTKEAGALLGPRLEEIRAKSIVQVIPETGREYTSVKEIIKDTIGFLI